MPNSIEQHINYASTQIELNRFDNAAHAYRQALAIEPNNTECLLRLSYVLMRMKCYSESLHFARHLLRIVDDVAYGYFLAGYAAREIGRWKDSRKYLLRAVELDPSYMYARVLCCMSAFTVCMDVDEAASIMHAYALELDQLISDTNLDTADRIDSAVDGIRALAPFFLPYLGYDVTALQAKYGIWVCSVMAAKFPRYTKALTQRSASGRIKIGIISNYFHEHSHWKISIKGWLEQLDRNLFSIHCFHTGDIRDAITEYASSISDSFVHNSAFDVVMGEVADLNLDVVIHSGIGMDTNTLILGGVRLAPVQCTTFGHPVTTGMPTIDFFISGKLVEPPDGDRHYTEKLIKLPNLPVYCEPVEPLGTTCAEIFIPGARQDDVLFLCCQNLMKYLPQYDDVFPRIAAKARNVRFVFIHSHVAELTERFTQRLEQAFQRHNLNANEHISYVPFLNEIEYKTLNSRIDVFLDSIGWSGGNTTLESLPYNKPIVTFAGSFMRGLVTCGMLKMMGIEDTIAHTAEEYVAISVRLAEDKQWRDEMSAQILRNKHKLYRDRAGIKALERFLIDVSGRNSGDYYAVS